MPTTIQQLESTFHLKYLKSIKWGTSFIESNNGIYIISKSKNKDFLPEKRDMISINENQVDIWLKNAPHILLKDKNPTKIELINHLKGFWFPDESILYIGKAEMQTLSERIYQFYNHKVGKKSPHKGGYWMKLLNDLPEFYIHLFSTKESHKIEEGLLKHYIENVSNETKVNLIDKDLCIPFANLQLRSRVIKAHGLKDHYQ